MQAIGDIEGPSLRTGTRTGTLAAVSCLGLARQSWFHSQESHHYQARSTIRKHPQSTDTHLVHPTKKNGGDMPRVISPTPDTMLQKQGGARLPR